MRRLEAVLLDAGFSKDDFDRAVREMDKNQCALDPFPPNPAFSCTALPPLYAEGSDSRHLQRMLLIL